MCSSMRPRRSRRCRIRTQLTARKPYAPKERPPRKPAACLELLVSKQHEFMKRREARQTGQPTAARARVMSSAPMTTRVSVAR
jgi:hypothetical protein